MYYLLELLKRTKIVKEIKIFHFVDEESIQIFHVRATLIDGSILFVYEFLSDTENKYAYHWQDKSNQLICRWDNAPHHRKVETFPHHKHKRHQKKILASCNVSLSEILRIIENEIQ